MYLPRVGYYRCHPVPTASRVDDKLHRLVTVENAQVAVQLLTRESQLGSLAAPLSTLNYHKIVGPDKLLTRIQMYSHRVHSEAFQLLLPLEYSA